MDLGEWGWAPPRRYTRSPPRSPNPDRCPTSRLPRRRGHATTTTADHDGARPRPMTDQVAETRTARRGRRRASPVGRPAGVGRPGGRRRRGADPPRRDRAARRRPRPPRGRPGHRQDAPRPRDRAQPRPPHGARPGHAGPAALGRHRLEPVRARRPPVRRGPGVHEPAPRRRDQPRDAAHAERAARGDAGAPGQRGGHDPPPARPVPRARDAEPRRVRGHVRAARRRSSTGSCSGPGWATPTGTGSDGSRAATRPPPTRSRRSSPSSRGTGCSTCATSCGPILVADEVEAYAVALVRATRGHADIELGASPRATVALYRTAQAAAALAGRAS